MTSKDFCSALAILPSINKHSSFDYLSFSLFLLSLIVQQPSKVLNHSVASTQGRSKWGGQVGTAHPRILLAHPRIKVKHIKNKIHLQYLSIICLWFKIWPTPAKNHCYALASTAVNGMCRYLWMVSPSGYLLRRFLDHILGACAVFEKLSVLQKPQFDYLDRYVKW
jgi:hypothetical protein